MFSTVKECEGKIKRYEAWGKKFREMFWWEQRMSLAGTQRRVGDGKVKRFNG